MASSEIRVGISSYTYPWSIGIAGDEPAAPMTADDLLGLAIGLDVPVVQIADNLPLDARPETELLALRDRADSAGIQIEVGTRGIDPEHLSRFLDIAVLFHSPILRVVVDRAGHEPEPGEIVALLRHHESRFRAAGITLALENHDRLPARVLADIVTELGSDWAGVCLDTVNSLGALEGPEQVIRTLAPYVVNLHVKDFTIVRSNSSLGFDVRGRPVGAGRLDVDSLLRDVRGRMAPLTAVIELWTPRQPDVEQTVALEQRWARQSVEFLKHHLAVPAERLE